MCISENQYAGHFLLFLLRFSVYSIQQYFHFEILCKSDCACACGQPYFDVYAGTHFTWFLNQSLMFRSIRFRLRTNSEHRREIKTIRILRTNRTVNAKKSFTVLFHLDFNTSPNMIRISIDMVFGFDYANRSAFFIFVYFHFF